MIGGACLMALALLGGYVYAQAGARPDAAAAAQENASAQGELLQVDTKVSTLQVRTATGDTMTFRYNDQTRVTGANKTAAELATMTGSMVSVQYRKDGTENVAMSIAVRAGGRR
jgi:hypothetical protein